MTPFQVPMSPFHVPVGCIFWRVLVDCGAGVWGSLLCKVTKLGRQAGQGVGYPALLIYNNNDGISGSLIRFVRHYMKQNSVVLLASPQQRGVL